MSSPIVDWGKQLYRKSIGRMESSGSSTDSGKLPPAWEEANKRSREAQLSKKGVGQKTAVAKSKAKRGQRKAASIKRYGG